nr:nuclear transport factor 2 family protein [Massilia sp. ST3]
MLCASLLQAASAGANEHTLRATLAQLERDRAEAIEEGDTDTLQRLMDRSYLHVDSRGRVRSKTELLTRLERQEMRFRSYDLEAPQVQLVDGGAAAIVTGMFRSSMGSAGDPRPFRGRYVRVWVRQPDGWKNTFHQVTEIRPQP